METNSGGNQFRNMKYMEVINNVIGMAIREGTLSVKKALAMTEVEKVEWFNELLSNSRESEML